MPYLKKPSKNGKNGKKVDKVRGSFLPILLFLSVPIERVKIGGAS